jgi:hypothetical protein
LITAGIFIESKQTYLHYTTEVQTDLRGKRTEYYYLEREFKDLLPTKCISLPPPTLSTPKPERPVE